MKYAIFGAGIICEQILAEYWDELDINIVFDNNREESFYGLKTETPRYVKNIFIIVASDQYQEIRKQLLELGYSEFSDFVPYQIFHRKMAIAYGNCHMQAVKEYLERNKDFAKDYGFYPFPMIQLMKNPEEYKLVLPHCTLFLHQAIQIQNKYGEQYASQNLIQHLSGQCQIISIPNLYGMPDCFFPQQDTQKSHCTRDAFYFHAGEDIKIEEWIAEGKTEKEIKAYLTKGGVYEKQEILKLWERFQNRLYEREKEWDIKISDYILDNYKTTKLFYEKLHISHVLVREIASRTLQYMGYQSGIPYELPMFLDYREMFIYQDVMNALDLQFEQNHIRLTQKNYPFDACYMDIDTYIHQTCKWIRHRKHFDGITKEGQRHE